MKTDQLWWNRTQGWKQKSGVTLGNDAGLAFVFGASSILRERMQLEEVRTMYPNAVLFGCSTSGEIFDTEVMDESLTVTALQFEHTQIRGGRIPLSQTHNSYDAGRQLAALLDPFGLKHVMVLSDGLSVNGSELVSGLTYHLPDNVTVTGGLAGDGASFKETYVIWEHLCERNMIAIIGFYGQRLKVGYGSLGGWDPFGPQRHVTRSEGNRLYELDGISALDLYRKYLGEHARELPSSGLLFPLCLRTKTSDTGVVRTILGIDEKENSMIFAGDIPEGAYAQLMKANFDRLIDGACGAARTNLDALDSATPDLAVLISCVGRKLVLKQRVEEEVEGVRDILGKQAVLTGFYSYGEISPMNSAAKCELHNQTMTITTFLEE